MCPFVCEREKKNKNRVIDKSRAKNEKRIKKNKERKREIRITQIKPL